MARKTERKFLGREAVENQLTNGVQKMLAGFTLDDPSITLGGRETIFRNNKQVGWLTSGGYGHTLQKSIGYGYVRNHDGVDEAYVLDGDYELEVASERVPCSVHMRPLYDAGNLKVKC